MLRRVFSGSRESSGGVEEMVGKPDKTGFGDGSDVTHEIA